MSAPYLPLLACTGLASVATTLGIVLWAERYAIAAWVSNEGSDELKRIRGDR